MAVAQAERRPVQEWSIPLFKTTPLAPLWIWLCITASWMAIFLVYTQLLLVPVISTWEFWWTWGFSNLHTAALLGYVPAATLWSQRGVLQTLQALRPSLRFSEAQFQDQLHETNAFRVGRLVIAALIGTGLVLTFGVVVWVLLPPEVLRGEGLQRYGFSPEESARIVRLTLLWEIVRSALVGVAVSTAVYIRGSVNRHFSTIGEQWTEVDLIDLSPLRCFTDLGLRTALLLIVAAVLVSTAFLFVPGDAITLLILIALPLVAAVALLAPLLGVHRRIQHEKRAELDRVRADIREAKQAGSTTPQGRLADLIAYEGRIESVNTWLYDSRALLRFGLILGAGMSMIAGALVERIVDTLLG